MLTFPELAHRYFEEHLSRSRSCAVYERLWVQHFARQEWLPHPTRSQIRLWVKSTSDTPAWSNKGVGFLRALYNWALAEELYVGENPAMGIKKHQTFSRSTVMTHDELRRLMTSLDFCHWKFRAILTVLLGTGCRLSEAMAMQWSDMNLPQGTWTKPMTKNGRPHQVPLPRQVVAALSSLPRVGDYCFTVHGACALSASAPEKAWGRFRALLRLQHIRLHDLRRTVATRLYEQGEPEILIKSILNHHDGNVTAVYIRPSFDRQAQALQRHADSLWALTQEVQHDTSSTYPSAPDLGLCTTLFA